MSRSIVVQPLLRFSGASLFAGGVLAVAVNATLTPLLPAAAGFVAVATSPAFGIRMPLAALSVALTTMGCVGLYLVQARRLRVGSLAFLAAAAGGLMTFAAEAVQATLIRDLAFGAPEMLERLDGAGELGRYDLAFAVAAGIFLLGWLTAAIVTWRTGILPRRGPMTFILGLVLVAMLGALAGVWGAAAGNLVVGSGWALMGLDLWRAAGGDHQPPNSPETI